MAVTFDITNFTTSIDLARASELINRLVVEHPLMSRYHNIVTGIGRNRQIAFVNEFGLVGKALTGCTISESNEQLIFTQKTWEFNPIGDRLPFCNATINADIQLFERTARMMPDWFTDERQSGAIGDKLALIVTKTMTAIIRSQNIKNWFSDTAADTVDNGGYLTNGTDTAYFTIFEGLYKQLFTDIPVGNAQHVAIPQNAESTKAEQLTYSKGEATAILKSMVSKMTKPARQARANGAEFVFHCTTEFYQAYESDIAEDSASNAIQASRQESGIDVLRYKGIELIDRVDLSSSIEAYYDQGTIFHLPNRVLLTMRDNIPVGVLNEDELDSIELVPDVVGKRVLIDFAYSQDVKHLQNELTVFAY